MENSMVEEIHTALDTLAPRDARVLRLYFGINSGETMTLEQIGNTLNLTKERVRVSSGPGVRPHAGTRYVFVHDPDGNLIELAKHET